MGSAKKIGKLTPKEMKELQEELLRNLSDPEIRKRVEEAQARIEIETQESAGQRLAKLKE